MSERKQRVSVPVMMWFALWTYWLVAFAAWLSAHTNGDHLTRIEQKVDRIAAEVRE